MLMRSSMLLSAMALATSVGLALSAGSIKTEAGNVIISTAQGGAGSVYVKRGTFLEPETKVEPPPPPPPPPDTACPGRHYPGSTTQAARRCHASERASGCQHEPALGTRLMNKPTRPRCPNPQLATSLTPLHAPHTCVLRICSIPYPRPSSTLSPRPWTPPSAPSDPLWRMPPQVRVHRIRHLYCTALCLLLLGP